MIHVQLFPIENKNGSPEILTSCANKRPCIEWKQEYQECSQENKNNSQTIINKDNNSKKVHIIKLGRNLITKIADTCISRNLVEIHINTNLQRVFLVPKKDSSMHKILLRGKRVLNTQSNTIISQQDYSVDTSSFEIFHGDTISLLNDKYGYIVNIITANNDNNHLINSSSTFLPLQQQQQQDDSQQHDAEIYAATNSLATIASMPVESISSKDNKHNDPYEQQQQQPSTITAETATTQNERPSLHKQNEMVDEVMCALCMDIIIDTTVLVPCGHMYCKDCILPLTVRGNNRNATANKNNECPHCRAGIIRTIPSKHMDNVIWYMLLSNLFTIDDSRQYIKRSTKRVITNEERRQILGSSYDASIDAKEVDNRISPAITQGIRTISASSSINGNNSTSSGGSNILSFLPPLSPPATAAAVGGMFGGNANLPSTIDLTTVRHSDNHSNNNNNQHIPLPPLDLSHGTSSDNAIFLD